MVAQLLWLLFFILLGSSIGYRTVRTSLRISKGLVNFTRATVEWHLGPISVTKSDAENTDGEEPTIKQNGTSYSKKEVMLNVAKQPSAAYKVQLPKGMSYPVLTKKEQVVADRVKQSLEENPNKSDLDLLKEELRKIIEKLE
jgi:hypothetical protein